MLAHPFLRFGNVVEQGKAISVSHYSPPRPHRAFSLFSAQACPILDKHTNGYRDRETRPCKQVAMARTQANRRERKQLSALLAAKPASHATTNRLRRDACRRCMYARDAMQAKPIFAQKFSLPQTNENLNRG